MLPEIERFLIESTLVGTSSAMEGRDLRFVVEKSHNKSLVYIFAYGMARPAFFAKLTTFGYKVELLRREHELLTHLASILPPQAGGWLPKTVAFQTFPGGAFTIQTALGGLPMSSFAARFGSPFWKRKADANFKTALNWLVDIGRRTLSLWPKAGDYDPSPALPQIDFSCLSHFTVAYHGDFAPQHILMSDRLAGVIDWELGSMHGPPAFDLFNFALRYMALIKKSPSAVSGRCDVETVWSVFFDKNRFSRLFANYAAEYRAAFEIDRVVLKELARLYLNSLGAEFGRLYNDFEKYLVL